MMTATTPVCEPSSHVEMQTNLIHLSDQQREAQRKHFAPKKRYCARDYQFLLGPYLDTHESMTLAAYVGAQSVDHRRILLLRHDIDHDYETALRMAQWERARGLQASYCVLHTAWYYGRFTDGRYLHTDQLVQLCGQLHAMGHEVLLHNNAVVLALQTGADPRVVLHQELGFLRGLGIPVIGTATHGDAVCRAMNFGNFEIFSEAVKSDRGGARTVSTEHAEVQLGSLRYADLDLVYEAYDIARDIYITDSGGRLRATRNAPGRRSFGRSDPSSGEVIGVLTHPVWWHFGPPCEDAGAPGVAYNPLSAALGRSGRHNQALT